MTWTKCSERMPTDTAWKIVKVTPPDGGQEWLSVACWIDGLWAWQIEPHNKLENVSAWMPFPVPWPDPPKEE